MIAAFGGYAQSSSKMNFRLDQASMRVARRATDRGTEMQSNSRAGLLQHGTLHPKTVGEALIRPETLGFTHWGGRKSDYRGEIKVILANLGSEAFAVGRGERIVQLVPAAVQAAMVVEADSLDDTARGVSGFGSTGR